MHPSDLELVRLASQKDRGKDGSDPVALHVAECEQCRDEVALIAEALGGIDAQHRDAPVRTQFEEAVIRMLRRQPSIIQLVPFDIPAIAPGIHSLAADGGAPAALGLSHRATLYSEDPEVIMRVMHDPVSKHDVLQLTAAKPELMSRVYIHLVDPPLEILTDENGRAQMPTTALEHPEKLSWRLQLPDAVFTLRPLETKPATTETVIDSPDGDSVAVSFSQDPGGISLRVRPLRIHGQEPIARVRVLVCQPEGRWQAVDTRAQGECVAANLTPDSPIEIRLYIIE